MNKQPLTEEQVNLKENLKQFYWNTRNNEASNGKEIFDLLCDMEDFEVEYWKLQQEKQELIDYLEKEIKLVKNHHNLNSREQSLMSEELTEVLERLKSDKE